MITSADAGADQEVQGAAQVLGPVTDDDDVPDVDPSRRSCSASQGPLRSVTRPVSTSVPVTTMPARTGAGALIPAP